VSKTPTPGTLELLRELRADPQHGTQARLGLGSAAHSLADSDPATAIQLVEEIEQDLKQAKTPHQVETGLRALTPATLSLSAPAKAIKPAKT
jgi:uncharacterized membrane protein